ncbi:MAG: hypothetical protein GY915_01635, partial [bacterium]|nr:hypothetical protein [bacterium]
MRNFLWMSLFVGLVQMSSVCVAGDDGATKKEGQEEHDESSTLIVLPQLTVPIVRHGVIFSYYILSLTAKTGSPEKALQVRQRIPFLMDALFSDLYKILALNYQKKIPKERIKIYISAIYDKVFGKETA